MDLEEELMDLRCNETVYLSNTPHSQSIPPPRVIRDNTTTDRSTNDILSPSLSTTSSVIPPGILPTNGTAVAPSNISSIEVMSWSEQVEMALAAVEQRYNDWQSSVELQVSIPEEERLQLEQQRIQNRVITIQELKNVRAATLQHISSTSFMRKPSTLTLEFVRQTLNTVFEQSAIRVEQQSDVLWTRLVQDLPTEERDYVAMASDEKFLQQMKYPREPVESIGIIQEHLKSLFCLQPPTKNGMSVGRIPNHSLGQTLREFADIFHHCYAPYVATMSTCQQILPIVAADVNHFTRILVQVLIYKYKCLNVWRNVLTRSVLEALFEHLQPTLHGLYVSAFAQEDTFFSQIANHWRSKSLECFGIRPQFRLDGLWKHRDVAVRVRDPREASIRSFRQYETIIQQLDTLSQHRSPYVRAELLASVCKAIDQQIKTYYSKDAISMSDQEALNVTGPELCALLLYVLVSAPNASAHAITQIAILGSYYMTNEGANGQEGYAIATITSTISHLSSLI